MKFHKIILFLLFFQTLSSFCPTQKKQKTTAFYSKDFTLPKSNAIHSSDTLCSNYAEKFELIAESAIASYYHDKFNGRLTASGSIFNNNEYTAAHKSLPFGTKVQITNTVNQKSIILTITDRGPFTKGRTIDLSKKAFMEITDNNKKGTLKVIIEKIDETQIAESEI